MITEWEYLMPVAKDILQSYVCIRLLIEVNCMNALKPIQVMAGESGGPYTCKTSLGLCIVGPIINGDSKGSVSCHRVTVKDTSKSQVASHYFEINDFIKEITF